MILVDHDFHNRDNLVEPFDKKCVNPASLDLRCGNLIRTPHTIWQNMTRDTMTYLIASGAIEDMPKWSEPLEFSMHWLYPGDFVLCHSLEHTTLQLDEIGLLFLKSSSGRIGLEHLHAGFGDPAFSGQWTWELQNVAPWPVKLEAGKRLMQMVVVKLANAPIKGYDETGRYQGQKGPQPEILETK